MRIITLNSVYTFDKVEDAGPAPGSYWKMTSTNPNYAGPWRVTLLSKPEVGKGLWMAPDPVDYPNTFRTSKIVDIYIP